MSFIYNSKMGKGQTKWEKNPGLTLPRLVDPEGEGNTNLRNVGNYPPFYLL